MSYGDSVASAETTQADSFEIPDDTIKQSVHLFNVLSSQDAIRIFLYAERGIESSTQAIKDLGLTQKRYYSRLKGLLDVGLIEKVEGTYQYTALGKIVHKLGLYLTEVLNNRDRIKLLNTLTKTELLSSSEISQISEILSDQPGELEGLLDSIMDRKKRSKVETLETFENLVEKVVEQIDLSQSSIFIATNYLDARVMNSSLKALDRNVAVKCIFSKAQLSSKFKTFKLLLSPKYMVTLLAFVNSSISLNELIREGDVPFSFVIIDDYMCFFELPSFQDKFAIAFYLVDENTAKRFSNLFHYLWDVGETSSTIEFLEKLKKL